MSVNQETGPADKAQPAAEDCCALHSQLSEALPIMHEAAYAMQTIGEILATHHGGSMVELSERDLYGLGSAVRCLGFFIDSELDPVSDTVLESEMERVRESLRDSDTAES